MNSNPSLNPHRPKRAPPSPRFKNRKRAPNRQPRRHDPGNARLARPGPHTSNTQSRGKLHNPANQPSAFPTSVNIARQTHLILPVLSEKQIESQRRR